MMDWRIVAGAVAAFVVFSVLVFFLYQQQEAQPVEQEYEPSFGDTPFNEEELFAPEPGSVLGECGSQETDYKRDLCWLFLAGDNLDAGQCMNISERPVRIDCIRAVAVDFESPETTEGLAACDALLEVSEGEEELAADNLGKFYGCLDAIWPRMRSEKLAVCDAYLSDDEPQLYMCYSEVASEFLDYGICDQMPAQPTNYAEHCTWIVDSESA